VADLSTSNGCSPLVNGAWIAGNIALIDRGYLHIRRHARRSGKPEAGRVAGPFLAIAINWGLRSDHHDPARRDHQGDS
jgi:hypothetical protein